MLTGASGFIGRHCLRELIREGYDVAATYHAKAPETACPEQVRWIRADLTDDLSPIGDILRETPVDALLHLAWNVGKGYQSSADNRIWLEKSVALIRLFAERGGKRVITAGSCFEYGASQYPLREDSPLHPGTLYGECKRSLYLAAERLCRARGISYAHMRIFYPFGAGEREARVIPFVIDELLAGRSPSCSSGVQVLDYMCVEDVARAIVQCLKTGVQGPVNIGSGEGVALRELLTFIRDEIGGGGTILFAAETPADRKIEIADVSRLREAVGFVPSMSRDMAISKYIEQRKAEKKV